MKPEELEEIKKRRDRALPGPWTWDMHPYDENMAILKDSEGCNFAFLSRIRMVKNGRLISMETADFITASLSDVSRLLEYVETLQGRELRLRDELDRAKRIGKY